MRLRLRCCLCSGCLREREHVLNMDVEEEEHIDTVFGDVRLQQLNNQLSRLCDTNFKCNNYNRRYAGHHSKPKFVTALHYHSRTLTSPLPF
jgi:hypothetical protein